VHDDLEVVGVWQLSRNIASMVTGWPSTTSTRRRRRIDAAEGRRAGARRADHRDAPDRALPPSTRSGLPGPKSDIAVPPVRQPEQMFSMGRVPEGAA
jgi:hypothetical protein